MTPSSTHLVLIPSYNTGPKVLQVVAEARRFWNPVWVVVDGSTDGSGEALTQLAGRDPGMRVLHRACNGGKGAAVLDGLREAEVGGFTHALVMDADGQHPAAAIPEFMGLSLACTKAMVLGIPVFDHSAPRIRVLGRRLSNGLADLETLWTGVGDSLFGFRVYPIAELRRIMTASRWMRGFDFDPEAVVRLCWLQVPIIAHPAPVRYFRLDESGVSHFHYIRDNVLLTWMHARLMIGFMTRLPQLVKRRLRSSRR